MAANSREQVVAWGFKKQADIATANVLAGIWRLNKLNGDLANPQFVTENDAQEYGKGHEFATQEYVSHVNVGPLSIEKYLSSQIMAWAAAFALGNVALTGSGPYTYTCTPLDRTTGEELAYFSYLEAIRQGGSAIWDKMYVGCQLNDFLVTVGTAPGRASAKIKLGIIGSGKITEPSGITLPAKTTENELPGSSLALTINGVNYVSNKNIISLEWGWQNNINADAGFYPGSGALSDGYAIRGRLEVGDRSPILNFTARAAVGTPEYATLRALTTGTAVITQTFSANETYTATFQQTAFKMVELGETDGKVTFKGTLDGQYHATNGVLTVVAKTAFANICQ